MSGVVTSPINLLDLDRRGLESLFASLGEKPFRAGQVMRWIHQHGIVDFDAMTDLGKGLRARLSAVAEVRAPAVALEQASGDGSCKWLIRVDSGNCVESVFIPEAGRGTLCVSSQVGCALNCSFCSTARQGFNRNLTASEIVGQLWQASRALGDARMITNVVMMGMGEPLLNYDNVLPALRLMLDDNAYGLSRRRVTVSTAGIVPMIDRLREDCPVALAVSLHAPTDRLRDELMPINRKYPLRSLMAACARYLKRAPRDSITFEYVLLDGVHDREADARALLGLIGTVSCKVNLIPFNPFPNSGFRRSPPDRIRRFAESLQAAGVITTTRKTRGANIDAACGQLAGKVEDRTRRSLRIARVA